MKKNIIFFLVAIFVSITLIYFVFDRIGSEEIWEAFLSFSLFGVFSGILLTALISFLGALRWKFILKDRGYEIPTKKIISPWIAGFGMSYFTPFALFGGEAFRAYILNKRFSVSWGKAIVSIIIDKILDGSIFFLTIIFGIIFFLFEAFIFPLKLWMIILILFFPIGGISFFYFKAFKGESMVGLIKKPLEKFTRGSLRKEIISNEKDIFSFFNIKNENMKKSVALSFLKGIVNWLRSLSILWFLGIKTSAVNSFITVAFTNLAYIFPLPAAIGSHEALQALFFPSLGLLAGSAVAFTLILRAFDTAIGILGIFVILKFGTGWIGKNTNDDDLLSKVKKTATDSKKS